MSKEQLIPIEQGDIKKSIGESITKSVGEFLEKDSDTTVSQAQMEAFARVVNALPEGKFKKLVGRLENPQRISSKFNEHFNRLQDDTWKIVKPFVVVGAPLVAAIPKEPFKKFAIKSSRLGGFLGEKIVKTSVEQSENIKIKLQKFKDRKNQT
jgi:hypothetical protein